MLFVKFNARRASDASAVELQMEENKILKDKIRGFEADLAYLKAKIDTLKALDQQVKNLSNLELDDQREAVAGQSTKLTATSEEEVSAKVDSLLREAIVRRGSFNELLQTLNGQRYVVDHTPSILPTSGWVVAGYGYRENPFTGRTDMHLGVDIAALRGTPIYATADGRVSFVGYRPGYGLLIKIDHGLGRETWYAHCSITKVGAGEFVKRGEIIGTVGKTGQAVGPHVHYEVRINDIPVDPSNYFLTRSEYSF
jgi:murein DD-endopeptidase MepM/ murein hydrolase activator NlpD